MKADVLFLIEFDSYQENPKGNVFAYFPNEKDFDIYGNKPCYAHIGQHSGCTPSYAEQCESANETQYTDLLKELQSIGYKLRILNAGASRVASPFNGKVLFQNKKWSVEICTVPQTDKKTLVVIRDSFFTDFVMRYEDKSIAFDFPERIPQYIKDKVSRFSHSAF